MSNIIPKDPNRLYADIISPGITSSVVISGFEISNGEVLGGFSTPQIGVDTITEQSENAGVTFSKAAIMVNLAGTASAPNTAGAIIFDTAAGKLKVYTGAGWETITSS